MLLYGSLEAHFSTGTEGIVWAFTEAGKDGYEGFHEIEHGHRLTVFSSEENSSILWQGRVELDRKNRIETVVIPAGKFGNRDELKFTAQRIFGNSVKGLPETCDEHLWLHMFTDEKPAILEI